MAAFFSLLLVFFSFFLWFITPFLPLLPAALILLLQLAITVMAFIFWRRRRKKGLSAFFRAFLVAIHFLFLIAISGVIVLVNLPEEKQGDSLGFLQGLQKLIREKTNVDKSKPEINFKIIDKNSQELFPTGEEGL